MIKKLHDFNIMYLLNCPVNEYISKHIIYSNF